MTEQPAQKIWSALFSEPPDLWQQLLELKRERAVREQVYPRLIASKKLRPTEAERRNACLDAAIETLQVLYAAQCQAKAAGRAAKQEAANADHPA